MCEMGEEKERRKRVADEIEIVAKTHNRGPRHWGVRRKGLSCRKILHGGAVWAELCCPCC